MAKTLFEKMFLKPEYSLLLLHVPPDLQNELTANNADYVLKNTYNFIVAFYEKKGALLQEVEKLKESLETNGLLWIAYPKGKALRTDLNRDILHETTKQNGLDGVSLISLNETWSAMRFKNK
ncbi:MAG TPA: hypothetical protein VLF89_08770 [Candidatus Saccharimonadales bacterium]|nr:hypothetical protein [Candidatus Saccharimonadales bacterium]